MSAKRCMNARCMAAAAAAGGVWRKGWLLRSGGFATLCDKCGFAYEQLVFCDKFHQKESGWRECAFCGKRLHCGCIASKSMLDLLDGGGVQCLSCLKNFENCSVLGESIQNLLPQSSQLVFTLPAKYSIDEKMNEIGTSLADGSSELHPTSSGCILNDGTAAKCNVKFHRNIEVNGCSSTMLLAQRGNMNGSFEHVKQERVALHLGELGRPGCSVQDQGQLGLSQISHWSDNRDASKENYPLAEACHIMSLGSPIMSNILEACPKTGAWQVAPSHLGAVNDGRDQKKASSIFHVERVHYGLPKLPKTIRGTSSDVAKELVPQMRVARPPAEGKGRNQLLPRYWPRITEQELQQISGDSNSTIVPLFEKVLSASDAGRIGRLVLPKACAEAYFPPISQPEGLPLKIQDSKGKEWHFQFRFWPNNNSRMYVLEGVTPCIQSLQLQAGDTVTFSRIDPEGKLLMGFRKATNTGSLQDSQISAMANAALGSETFYSEVNEGLSVVSGYSGFLQSFKGTGDPQFSHFSKNSNYADGNFSCTMTHKLRSWEYEGLLHPLLVPEKRRSRNIGSKSKRLLMDNEDAMELKLTWEEAQDLLRPPPSVKPSIVIIEDQEFEEYEEPPVLGKRTFFTARASGGQDQWIQCDDCFKWRRIPVEVMPPLKWACADNTWDSKRSSCAEPDELTSMELQALLRQHAEIKRRRIASSKESPPVVESTGLEEVSDQATPSVAATTRHPRHRPGCACIVCIQPPSGKGPKHSSTCTCNVCTTVKRRFNTIMLRKKKRQSDREEAELSKTLLLGSMEEVEGLSTSFNLNCQPHLDGEQQPSSPQVSMMNLLQVASFLDENYLKQKRLISDQQVSPIACESAGDDENCGSDKVISDAAVT